MNLHNTELASPDPDDPGRDPSSRRRASSTQRRSRREMVIDLDRGRRLLGWAAWLGAVAVVAAVLVVLFVQFTASLRMALALVGFMLGYMALMAFVTLRRSRDS